MNLLKATFLVRHVGHLAVLAAALVMATALRAADAPQPQPGRFLLVFETSPTMKKNLPQIRQTLGSLFANNLQGQMQAGDDVAVWTVDQELHTGTFPLANWVPDEAEIYAQQLNDFLVRQKYTKRANLAALQPLLNRVAKGSDRLTVLIFSDHQGRLLGTPYDSGVNEIITNAAARPKGADTPFVLVLRSYHGEYLGCSVNRSAPLNFPKFPPPPKPEPPPVVKPPSPPVVAPLSGPVVTPVAAIIIRGTNASTNVSALLPPPYTPPAITTEPITSTNATAQNATPQVTTAPPPKTNPPPAVVVAPPVVTPQPNPPPPIVNTPTVPQPPVTTAPTPPQTLSKTPRPETSFMVPPPVTAATNTTLPPPPVVTAPTTSETTTNEETPVIHNSPAKDGVPWGWLVGGGTLVVVGALVWVVARASRPRGSLITSSMQDDPRLPPENK